MHYLVPLAVLWCTYLALSNRFDLLNILFGGVLGLVFLRLLKPSRRAVALSRLPLAAAALVRYVAVLFADLVISGIQVAGIVLHPKLPLRQGILAVPSGCASDLGNAISAHAITLTPGELVIEIDHTGTLYTHCLDVERSAKSAPAAQARRRRLIRMLFSEGVPAPDGGAGAAPDAPGKDS